MCRYGCVHVHACARSSVRHSCKCLPVASAPLSNARAGNMRLCNRGRTRRWLDSRVENDVMQGVAWPAHAEGAHVEVDPRQRHRAGMDGRDSPGSMETSPWLRCQGAAGWKECVRKACGGMQQLTQTWLLCARAVAQDTNACQELGPRSLVRDFRGCGTKSRWGDPRGGGLVYRLALNLPWSSRASRVQGACEQSGRRWMGCGGGGLCVLRDMVSPSGR